MKAAHVIRENERSPKAPILISPRPFFRPGPSLFISFHSPPLNSNWVHLKSTRERALRFNI